MKDRGNKEQMVAMWWQCPMLFCSRFHLSKGLCADVCRIWT